MLKFKRDLLMQRLSPTCLEGKRCQMWQRSREAPSRMNWQSTRGQRTYWQRAVDVSTLGFPSKPTAG